MTDNVLDSIADATLPLGKVIRRLRQELAALRDDAADEELRFRVDGIEVELQVWLRCSMIRRTLKTR